MKRIVAIGILCGLAGRALGQSFNIDFNNSSGSGSGVPAASYGGVAAQPGTWNNVTDATATTSTLVGLNGAATSVTLTRPTNGTFGGAADAGVSGDTAKLILDYDAVAGLGTLDYQFNNLQPGWYAAWTYAVRPNNTMRAGVTVTGSQSLYQYVGGDLSNNDMLPNVTYAIHIFQVSNNIPAHVKVADSPFGTATCNGIQIKKISSDDRIRFYVKKSAVGAQDGTSWATAYRDLQSALRMAENIGGVWAEVWTAQGFYYPTAGTDRNESFVVDSGLHLYGGFAGTESTLAERLYPALYITAMSGSIGSSAATDNSYHVVRANLADGTTIIDGFSIANGYANGSGNDAHGGGIICDNASLQIRNTKFLSNTSALDGGAVYTHGGQPKFVDCLWYNNTCSNGTGGAIYMHSSGKLWVYNGDFRKNYAVGDGGAISLNFCQSQLTNCFFDANTASFGKGGAFYTAGSDTDDSTITNCTFVNNHSGMVGGGIYVNNASDVTLNNSILWGNSDATGASVSAQQRGANGGTGATLAINFTTVQGINPDPQFVDIDGADNVAGNFDDDCRFQVDSPCIDAASNLLLPADAADMDGDGDTGEIVPLDLDKNPRRANVPSVIDTGAGFAPMVDRRCYEFQPCGPDFDGDGFLTGIDFDLFVQAYEAGELAADWDQDGFITGIDFDLYTQAYEAGC